MSDLYLFTVPVFLKSLGSLKNVLTKSQEAVQSGALDEGKLMQDKLWPDMFPFVKQVQVACDNAKGASARLAGVEAPKHEDTETTLAELLARVEQTIAFVETIKPEQFADAHERKVTLPYFTDKYMTGFDYAREYAIPNFFFHLTTAYGLARKNGVTLGKADFINGVPLRDFEK